MAFSRGIFGIEYDPAPERRTPRALGAVMALVAVAAAVSLSCTVYSRFKDGRDEKRRAAEEAARSEAAKPPPPETAEKAEKEIRVAAPEKRPAKVRNLLMRLEEAERRSDLILIVTTIEELRALPGGAVADIDDSLARRLGALNSQWLFEYRNAQWVVRARVKAGDSATRIAREYGSTLASFRRLNPSRDIERLRIGDEVNVMNRPRFNLVVSGRSRTADLILNGKFFKRYDLAGSSVAKPGAYEVGLSPRAALRSCGVAVTPSGDAEELSSLLPKGSTITVSDM
ncbi:MAG: LysM peptidoglycan-binding domain-containing protein [Kiritimatiellae bacterium]|nr:LysM peptidoglycan-binding domain-containing protein [Kiritimatiellia bacterium]